MGIERLRLLDVQEHGPTIADSVRIPLSELSARTHELPPKNTVIQVANTGPEAQNAANTLIAQGRQVELTTFTFGEASKGRLWEPNRFLQSVLPKIKPGTAIDLGCGSGRDAVWMASGGWNVVGIDRLPEALDLGRSLASKYLNPEQGQSITWQQADLTKEIDLSAADLMTCFYYLNRPLIARIVESLRPGADFLLEAFTAEHQRIYGKPKSDSLVLEPGELAQLINGLEVLFLEEGLHGDRYTARLWARKQD